MMREIGTKIDMALIEVKTGISRFVQEEQGDFGIGQIAGIVALVVVLGAIVSAVTGFMPDWIDTVWGFITNDLFGKFV